MMKGWQVSVRLHLAFVVLVGSLVGVLGLPVGAQEEVETLRSIDAVAASRRVGVEELRSEDNSTSLPPSDLNQPATTVEEWIAQIEASLVQITEVRVEETETGLQVVLETAEGELPVPTTQTIANTLIADISNAAIAENFEQVEPIAGIARVEVTSLPGDQVRVAITGTDAPPVAEVTSEAQGLAFAVTVGTVVTEEEEAIELVVTGEQDEGYNPSSASTATRTDTPLRDIPQSIQVVPRQVLEDRKPRTLTEAVETVSGVVTGSSFSSLGGSRIIRGFNQGDSGGSASFRNGFRDVDYYGLTPPGTIEQVEVVKGPASVLFGALEPGGIVNVITQQPLREPYDNLEFEAGNYGFYQPTIDLSGPLDDNKNILYRFIASYQGANSFQDFVSTNQTTIAPSITLNLGERTSLNLYYEYSSVLEDPYRTATILLSDGSFTPRNLFIGYPDFIQNDITTQRYGYILKHEFNDNWQIRNNFSVAASNTRRQADMLVTNVVDDRFVEFTNYDGPYTKDNYFGQIDLLGKVNTGSISHQLLVGFDFNRFVDQTGQVFFSDDFPSLDIRNPNYDISRPNLDLILEGRNVTSQSYGIYLQDQIAFNNNLKLLIGGRYDWVSNRNDSFGDGVDATLQNNGAFSPRLGLVYQPSDTVSLYASYSSSFRQATGFNPDGRAFEPTRGTQYELGVKADFLDGRLSTTLAAYHLTKTNVTTPDPDRPRFSIQTGEQRSQGIELDVAGEILPGWKVIASYAYTNAEVTKDNDIPVGNKLVGVPENQASLWTTYEIQQGNLKGLGFGLGLFYVGERSGDLASPFTLNDYLRTDAALYYRRDGFKAAINIRNLLDTDYAEIAFGRTFVERAKPFTITGSVSWEF